MEARIAAILVVFSIALPVLFPVAASAAPVPAVAAVSVQAPAAHLAGSWPSVSCATSGPATTWPSANSSQTRYCWWGSERFFSKNDTRRIVALGQGASAVIGYYLPGAGIVTKEVAIRLLLVSAGLSPFATNEVWSAIDRGTCLKLVMIARVVPYLATYRCT